MKDQPSDQINLASIQHTNERNPNFVNMENDGQENTDGLQIMAIMNSMKTGILHVDLILAMCIPLVLRYLFKNLEILTEKFFNKNYWFPVEEQGFKDRILVSSSIIQTNGCVTSLDRGNQNSVLIKAISLFIHSKLHLQMDSSYLDLTSTEMENQRSDDYYYDDEDEEDNSLVGRLSKYKLVNRPMPDVWHDLGVHGSGPSSKEVKLLITEKEASIGDGESRRQTNTITYHLRSTEDEVLDGFLDKAYNWYLDELRKLEKNTRYYYDLTRMDIGPDEGGYANYRRFELSDEKTFESLFFKQKETLLKIVNNFTEKSGKYGIKGYPHVSLMKRYTS